LVVVLVGLRRAFDSALHVGTVVWAAVGGAVAPPLSCVRAARLVEGGGRSWTYCPPGIWPGSAVTAGRSRCGDRTMKALGQQGFDCVVDLFRMHVSACVCRAGSAVKEWWTALVFASRRVHVYVHGLVTDCLYG
jgi:hypothetical protein